MPETINLIPKEERVQQTKTKVVKFSTILAVIILVLVSLAGAYFYYRVYSLKQQIVALDTSIESLRGGINDLADIEINARNLYSKSTTLQAIFDERIYYSRLLRELEVSTPEDVVVDSFGLGKDGSTVSVSGRAESYNAVQDFSNRLLERAFFSEVELHSVGLESRLDKIAFFVVVTFNTELLHE